MAACVVMFLPATVNAVNTSEEANPSVTLSLGVFHTEAPNERWRPVSTPDWPAHGKASVSTGNLSFVALRPENSTFSGLIARIDKDDSPAGWSPYEMRLASNIVRLAGYELFNTTNMRAGSPMGFTVAFLHAASMPDPFPTWAKEPIEGTQFGIRFAVSSTTEPGLYVVWCDFSWCDVLQESLAQALQLVVLLWANAEDDLHWANEMIDSIEGDLKRTQTAEFYSQTMDQLARLRGLAFRSRAVTEPETWLSDTRILTLPGPAFTVATAAGSWGTTSLDKDWDLLNDRGLALQDRVQGEYDSLQIEKTLRIANIALYVSLIALFSSVILGVVQVSQQKAPSTKPKD